MSGSTMETGAAGPELRDHEFDGIREYDNRLPNWWLWTFYLAIIFSAGYWVHFHLLGSGDLPREAFRKAMAEAAESLVAVEVSDESLIALSEEPTAVDEGRQLFMTNCFACHGATGGGTNAGVSLPGPNLTDKFWLHGGAPKQIYDTIYNGVEEKGMAKWSNALPPAQIQKLAAFVLTLRNRNVEGGKPPEGEPYDQG